MLQAPNDTACSWMVLMIVSYHQHPCHRLTQLSTFKRKKRFSFLMQFSWKFYIFVVRGKCHVAGLNMATSVLLETKAES
jgi:hypothetical protein